MENVNENVNENVEQENLPTVTVEDISSAVVTTLGGFVNVGPNGEAPQIDLTKFSPAPVIIGAMMGVCESYVQLHAQEGHRMDYVTAMSIVQDLFVHYLIDMNISAAIQAQMSMGDQAEMMQTRDSNC